MSQRSTDYEARISKVLDGLKITPERLRGSEHSAVVTTVDRIQPTLIRPSRLSWPFTELFQINLHTFNRRLRAALDPLRVGYCYMIRQRGRIAHLHTSGWAQLPGDGEIGWRLHTAMNVASVSKFVTAIAMIKLLRDARISVNTRVAQFLPQYWTQGPGIGSVTFHNLLLHRAGLGGPPPDSGNGDFATAKSAIASGTNSSRVGRFVYKNVNFAILRVLFATLTNNLRPSDMPPAFLLVSEDLFWNYISASAYSDYVNNNVFAPANIAPRDFNAGDDAAKAYATPPVGPGARIEDGYGGSGPSGWHLNIGELVRLLDAFRAGWIMPRWRAEQVLLNNYGLDEQFLTNAGLVYRKGGRKASGMQGIDSAIYLMPGDVNFAIFVNSMPGTATGPSHLDTIPEQIDRSIEFAL
jgi:hypothetical protein